MPLIHKAVRNALTVSLFIALTLAAQGCGLSGPTVAAPGSQEGTPFRPVTQAVEPTATEPLPTETAEPTEASDCAPNLTFITDVTFPDGTIVYPGSISDKRWEVKNSGTCTWGEGYSLRLTDGDNCKPTRSQACSRHARHQTTIQITFQAPANRACIAAPGRRSTRMEIRSATPSTSRSKSPLR